LPGAENADLLYGATKILKLVLMTVGLVLLSIRWKSPQPWCLIDILIMFFYNGKRGAHRMKYFFYIFYPAHLGIIYLISILVSML
ncbi:MAG: hypothetical protein HUJ75_01575, partial [Parasporobacterium sp.]|nr:hypothetical protein [Parasporobacterium sp.]